jgi:hypothetical protein
MLVGRSYKMKVIKLKEAKFKCPWGEKELYYGKVFNHPDFEDETLRPITVLKRGDQMFIELHAVNGVPIGEYEVVFI